MSYKNLTGDLKWPKSEYHRDFFNNKFKKTQNTLSNRIATSWQMVKHHSHFLYVEIKLQIYPFSIIVNDENQTDIQSITPGYLGPDGAMFDSF